MALTAKQEAFVNEYLISRNATRAAIAAGYSEKTAYAIGWENLRKPEIAKVISQRVTESAMSADEVLERLAKQARADLADFITVNRRGFEIDLSRASENRLTDLIKKLTQRTTVRTDPNGGTVEQTTMRIELHDSHAALVDLGRYHKLFTDKSEISGPNGGPVNYRDVSEMSDDELARIASSGGE